DHEGAAHRLRSTLHESFGTECELITLQGGNSRRGARYVLRIMEGGAQLARRTGLMDPRGRPVRGMPPAGVNGSGGDASGGLGGAARRLGVTAKAREVRQADRVVIRDAETITKLLAAMGAEQTVQTWKKRQTTKEVRSSSNRLANFDDANLRRSAQAAVAASARVTRALEILGDDVPDHLEYAGKLRVEHQH